MKKIYSLLLVAILTPALLHAEIAQKRKKKKKTEKTEQPYNSENPNTPKAPSQEALGKFEATTKSRYQIDVLLPIDIDIYDINNTVRSRTNIDAIKPYLEFYEGVKLAVAELEADSIPLDINIHNFNKSTLTTLTNDPKSVLLNSDLLLGVVYGNDVETLAQYGRNNTINFISAISPNNGNGEENVAFHILQPTLNTNIDVLSRYASKQFPSSKKVIFHQNNEREKEHFKTIKDAFPKDKSIVNFDLSYAQIDLKTLQNTLDSTRINCIFIPIIKPDEPERIINILQQLPENYRVEIFCMPSWNISKIAEKIKTNSNINMYATAPFQYDDNTAFVKRIKDVYASSCNGDKATEMVYRGYELLYWYAQILNKFGSGFNTANYDHQNSPYTPFNIQQVENESKQIQYFENKYLYINNYHKGIINPINQ